MAENKIKRYKAIGYWHSEQELGLPDPGEFIDENWDKTERQTVIDYLKKGETIAEYRGFSWCRFGCWGGFGTSDRTDGTYIYPEGLVHYVEAHHVRLPDDFIKHIKGETVKPTSFVARIWDTFNKSKNIVAWPHGEMDYDWWLSQKGSKTHHLSYKDCSTTILKSFDSREEGNVFWENEKNNPDLISFQMDIPSWLQYDGEFWASLVVKDDDPTKTSFSNEQIFSALEVLNNHLNGMASGEEYSNNYLMGGKTEKGINFTFIISGSKRLYDKIDNISQYPWGEFSKNDWSEYNQFDLELRYKTPRWKIE